MSKCKYNYNSLMGKTKKNAAKKNKDLEDLLAKKEELKVDELESDSGSESGSDSDSESGSESGTSMSKELNSMLNDGIDTVTDGSLTVPAIGLGLIAIIGFALYKGSRI